MAPIADIARANHVRFTSQEVADLMLSEDRARRRCLENGDFDGAALHDAELRKLEELIRHAA
jgi:hypothetical protein